MQRNTIAFDGFASGETDFATLHARSSQSRTDLLGRLLDRIVNGILAPADSEFNSVIVVGHGDRQDLSTMSCDQRRKSEHDAALKRAASATEWMLDEIDARLVNSGNPKVANRNDIQNMTWDMVFAGAGDLAQPGFGGIDPYGSPPPQTAQDRDSNRRVVFLVSPMIV